MTQHIKGLENRGRDRGCWGAMTLRTIRVLGVVGGLFLLVYRFIIAYSLATFRSPMWVAQTASRTSGTLIPIVLVLFVSSTRFGHMVLRASV